MPVPITPAPSPRPTGRDPDEALLDDALGGSYRLAVIENDPDSAKDRLYDLLTAYPALVVRAQQRINALRAVEAHCFISRMHRKIIEDSLPRA